MIKKLASIKLTFWSLLALVAALGTGVGFTYIKTHSKTIRTISEQLPLEWLLAGTHDTLVLVWFIITCLVGGVLFLNVLCCTWLRLSNALKNNQAVRQWLFILIHCMFAAVMLCHGLGMVVGYKHSNIELWPDATHGFDTDYEIKLTRVVFTDAMDILKADYQTRRSMMTRDTFHPEKNFAEIEILKNHQKLASGKLFLLDPIVYDGIQFTMTDFSYAKDKSPQPVGASLVITRNPVTHAFFISYTLLILSLIGFVIYTWRP